MHARRFRKVANPYHHEHHLSRTVRCSDCGAELLKDHNFVFYGNRCLPCWRLVTSSQENMTSH